MEVLTVLNLGDFAQMFSKMGMFPVFDLAYYIVSILYLKYEPGQCVSHFLVQLEIRFALKHESYVTHDHIKSLQVAGAPATDLCVNVHLFTVCRSEFKYSLREARIET